MCCSCGGGDISVDNGRDDGMEIKQIIYTSGELVVKENADHRMSMST
jgi:hypothetical protein